MNKKNNNNGDFSSKIDTALLYSAIPGFILLMISIFFCNWYYNFQILRFSNENTLLFVSNNIASAIIIVSPLIIIYFIMLNITTDPHIKIITYTHVKNVTYTPIKILKVKICLFIAIITFIISVSLIFCEFFDYTDINKEGIYVSTGIFLKSKEYKWSDVTSAEVSYKRGNKNKIEISYDIYLNDGKIVHAYRAENFFRDIINLDNFMKNKKVVINREKIHSNDYSDFVSQYKGPTRSNDDGLKVVLEIFNK